MIDRYAVVGNDKEWEAHPLISKNKIPNIISVKKLKRKLNQMNATNDNNDDDDNTMTNDDNLAMGNGKTKKQKN
jgi:hypothetical protein